MSGRLLLICHAATAARGAWFPGDETLTADGEARATALANRLGRTDQAWTAPSRSARQTAAALGLTATAEPALRDIDLGRWAGQSLAAVAADEADALAAWTKDPTTAPHGGETVVAVIERVRPWLALRVAEDHRSTAITHAAVLRAAILLAIGAGAASFRHIDVGPLCCVDLRSNSGIWRLRGIRTD